jgi:hypothetical protein
MQSDERVQAALDATQRERRSFLSAVRTAADQIEGRLRSSRDKGRDSAGRVEQELGSFASGRIDAGKLAAFEPQSAEPNPTAFEALERAAGVLREIARLNEDDFVVRVKPGDRMSRVLSERLSSMGRAFGAAELAALAHAGRPTTVDVDRRLEQYHPDDWSAREREIAPPLVVIAEGSTMRVGAVRDWLEGNQKIVFVVEGPCPSAPLAPLIIPGGWVAQIASPEEVGGFERFEGPAVCAFVPEGAAVFTHDPAHGLTLEIETGDVKVRPVGPITVWRQQEDLATLERMSGRGGPAGAGAGPSANGQREVEAAQPADRLAAWLLNQADLPAESPADGPPAG